jgi:hypothetical protein
VPPFTHAPLVHHGHSSSTPAQQSSSASYSYPYGYSGYPTHPAAPATSTIPGAPVSTQPTEPKPAVPTSTATDPDTAAAYEAAQNILSAINFGDLYQLAPEDRAEGATKDAAAQQATAYAPTADNGVEKLLSHVQAMLANAKAEGNNENNPPHQHPLPPGGAGGLGPGLTTIVQPQVDTDPSADPRAELQAQLALLAAQLADLAKTEEVPPQHSQPQVVFAAPDPPAHPTGADPPPPPPTDTAAPALPVVAAVTTTTSIHALPVPVVPAPAAPEALHENQEPEQPIEGEDDDSDDDDMEEII